MDQGQQAEMIEEARAKPRWRAALVQEAKADALNALGISSIKASIKAVGQFKVMQKNKSKAGEAWEGVEALLLASYGIAKAVKVGGRVIQAFAPGVDAIGGAIPTTGLKLAASVWSGAKDELLAKSDADKGNYKGAWARSELGAERVGLAVVGVLAIAGVSAGLGLAAATPWVAMAAGIAYGKWSSKLVGKLAERVEGLEGQAPSEPAPIAPAPLEFVLGKIASKLGMRREAKAGQALDVQSHGVAQSWKSMAPKL